MTLGCTVLAGVSWRLKYSEPLEVIGFISGALAVWLTVKENIWNWPIGIVNSATYVVVFFKQRLFADGGLQVIYVVLGFWGWWAWLFGGKNRTRLTVVRSPIWEYGVLGVITVAATWAMTLYLGQQKDAAPFLDAFTTVLSLVAQYQLTRKYLENWLIWIFVDIIYVPLYIWKGLYLTATLYVIFLVMAVLGLLHWRNVLQKAIAETA